jgi:hypothetical protein
MAARESSDAREAEILQLAQSETDKAEIRQHLSEVIEGEAFRGSPRGGRFLKYIVDHAIAGEFEALKERVIGTELFGRAASYNTGDDAIVRVTASDVRKRLLQHYGRYGTQSRFRLGLPLGSYIPEFNRLEDAHPQDIPSSDQLIGSQAETAATTDPVQQTERVLPAPEPVRRSPSFWILLWFAVVLSLIAIGLVSWDLYRNSASQPQIAKAAAFPWPAFFRSAPRTNLITSDPNIAEIQGFTGGVLSVSDYANHNYYVGPNKLAPEQEDFCRRILRGDKAASVDSEVAANIAALAALNGTSIAVRAARDIQHSDLKTDDNFIFLGSPRSDPWFAFFSDQLDFQFVLDKQVGSEFIRNVHPRLHEQQSYIPTAKGWTTGQSYAVIALVRNPDEKGQVLLLAGATAEGTAAAGKVVTDPSQLTPMLKRCGIDPSGPLRNFELLLRLNTMAGSADNIDYAACHALPSSDTSNQP